MDEMQERSVEELADAADLRAVITAALAAHPVDEQSLRRGVWTYVGAERHAGARPGDVIKSLAELIDAAEVIPGSTRPVLMQRAILWCVEAYFGHLGGDVARDSSASITPP